MTAVRNLIFAEIMERLTSIGDAAETELMPSSDPVSFPARHVFDGGQSLGETEAGVTRYALAVTIEGYLEQAGGADAHEAINELYAATVGALLPDPPLGGLAETIDEGDLRITVAPLASMSRLGFALDLEITFPTRRGHPDQPA